MLAAVKFWTYARQPGRGPAIQNFTPSAANGQRPTPLATLAVFSLRFPH
jgi:hypothetical protein